MSCGLRDWMREQELRDVKALIGTLFRLRRKLHEPYRTLFEDLLKLVDDEYHTVKAEQRSTLQLDGEKP